RHPLRADHAAADPGRRGDRGRHPPEPGAAAAACGAGGRGGTAAGGEGGGEARSRLRARLARKPPGYRFTIGRILVIYSGLMVTLLLAALDQTIVATALPKIVGELGGLGSYSWVFTSYLLASTVTVPLYGKLGDVYGRRPPLLRRHRPLPRRLRALRRRLGDA